MQDDGYDMDVPALAAMRAEGVAHTLRDVREPDEIAICVIEGSRSIPMQQIPQNLDALPRDEPLIVLCHHGQRSAMVADFLRGNGFPNARNLAGGINAWAQHVDSTMPHY